MISIIMPAYNYGRFIGASLDSVLQQDDPQWECLVMDNASTDDTAAVVSAYTQRDQRIRYHRLDQNQGPSVARNKALQLAQGSYILFLDADDLVAPRKLKRARQLFEEQGVDVVFSDYSFFKENPAQCYHTHTFTGQFGQLPIPAAMIRDQLVHGNTFAISCIVAKKECLLRAGGFDEAIRYNEDWDLWLRTSLASSSYAYDADRASQTLIRNHGSSHSKDQPGMYVAGLYVSRKNEKALDARQRRIFDRKIRLHRYKLKVMLVNSYYSNRAEFERVVALLDAMPLLHDELRAFRKLHWRLPAFMKRVYLLFLRVNYTIARQCL